MYATNSKQSHHIPRSTPPTFETDADNIPKTQQLYQKYFKSYENDTQTTQTTTKHFPPMFQSNPKRSPVKQHTHKQKTGLRVDTERQDFLA